MNSRDKGKRGERQWRDELRANGYHARRGQQFSGSPESPDVVCAELDWIHFEVKAVERLNIEDAMEQARTDCGAQNAEWGVHDSTPHPTPLPGRGGEGVKTRARKVPVVAHRRKHRRWLVTMEAEFFFQLLRGELPPGNGTDRTEGTDSTPHPGPVASQARHEMDARNGKCASRTVVPDRGGEGVGAHGVTRPAKTNWAEGGGDATGNQSATEKPEQTEY